MIRSSKQTQKRIIRFYNRYQAKHDYFKYFTGDVIAVPLNINIKTLGLHTKANRAIKRSVDVIISLLVITLLLWWLIPLMAFIIKLDSQGPVFFLQKRNKLPGELFTCIKLRTMIVNKEAV